MKKQEITFPKIRKVDTMVVTDPLCVIFGSPFVVAFFVTVLCLHSKTRNLRIISTSSGNSLLRTLAGKVIDCVTFFATLRYLDQPCAMEVFFNCKPRMFINVSNSIVSYNKETQLNYQSKNICCAKNMC